MTATLLPATAAPAASPTALANPCAAAPATAQLEVATPRVGLIDLHYLLAHDRPVTFFECVDGRSRWLGRLASARGAERTSLYAAASWDCERRTRRFAATTVQLLGQVVVGQASVQTMSCAQRFELVVPAKLRQGHVAHIGVTDTWARGDVHPRVCVRSPASKRRRSCRDVAFASSAEVDEVRLRLRRKGRWSVELQVGEFRVRDTIVVAGRKALPKLLTTGDSTMQGLERALSNQLDGETSIVRDARSGARISGPDEWTGVAASQAGRLRPAITVLSLGGNEGLPMKAADGESHACCDSAWSVEYERRLRATLRSYVRGGRGRVFVLTIPAPSASRRAAITARVNEAIVRVGAGRSGVAVLRMDLLFSPNGFQEVIRYDGHDVDVRDPDGVHLSAAGNVIASRVVARAIRTPQS